MEEILHHQKDGWNPVGDGINMDKPPINWCRISSIHSIFPDMSIFGAKTLSSCGPPVTTVFAQALLVPPLHLGSQEFTFTFISFLEIWTCENTPAMV